MYKISSNNKVRTYLVRLLVCLPLPLSVFFADPKTYSIVTHNLTPVRLFLPLLSFFVILTFISSNKLLKLRKDYIFLVLAGYLFATFISLFFSSSLGAGLGIVLFYISILLFYVALYFSKNYVLESKRLFLYTVLFTSLVTLTVSWLKYFAFAFKTKIFFWGHGGRYVISAFISDENHYALFLSITYFLNLYLLLTTKNIFIRSGSFFAAIFSVYMVVGTLSRSGLISLTAGVCVFGFLYILTFWRSTVKKKVFGKGLFVLALTIITIFLATYFYNFSFADGRPSYRKQGVNYAKDEKAINTSLYYYRDIPAEYSDVYKKINSLPRFFQSPSTKAHISLIYGSFVLGISSPIFGQGTGSFSDAMVDSGLNILYAKYDPGAAQSESYPAHTMYGQALAEGGFVGLGLYLLVLFFMLFYNINEEFFWFFAFLGL